MIAAIISSLFLQTASPAVLENEYVRVTRNSAPCASPQTPGCEQRVFVALSDVDFTLHWEFSDKGKSVPGDVRHFKRGDVVVVGPRDAYEPPERGEYLEVTIKPTRPPVKSPLVMIPPDKNTIKFDRDAFFVFEEKLEAGETRARHSHRERVVIVINKTRLQQWPDGAPELFRDQIPDDVRFNPPVVHVVKTVGDLPLRNIVIEFKK